MSGWIKIHRKIRNHWLMDDPDRFTAWCKILMSVNYAESKALIRGKLYHLKRGESINSKKTWAKIFGKQWDRHRVIRYFKLLEADGMIAQRVDQNTTILTVCNYETYQDQRTPDEPQAAHEMHNGRTTDVTPNAQRAHTEEEEYKNIKEDEEAREQPDLDGDEIPW